MKTNFKNIKEYIEYLKSWIEQNLSKAKKTSLVIGLSGGVDSACCFALAKKIKGIKIYPYYFVISSSVSELKFINDLEKKFKVEVKKIDLTKSLNNIVKTISVKDVVSINNMKTRLRMLCLYAIAQENNALVLGTSNADEIYTGYFTKFGDGVSDLAPIASITKKHVYEISKYLGVPETIINRVPTAGLYEGQTDEKELKVAYSEIDNFLLGKKVSSKAERQINILHNISDHKRNLINKPFPYKKIK